MGRNTGQNIPNDDGIYQGSYDYGVYDGSDDDGAHYCYYDDC